MKIIFYIWSLGVGGAERHTVDLSRRLRMRGHDVTILIHQGDVHPVFAEDVATCSTCIDGGRFVDVWHWLRVMKKVRHLRPDLVVAVNTAAACYAVPLSLITGVPLAVTFHGAALVRRVDNWKMSLLKAFQWSFKSIFCSENQHTYWRKRGFSKNGFAIQNGVDLERFCPCETNIRSSLRRNLGLNDATMVICHIAAFRPEKNHIGILEAAWQLKRDALDFRIFFVGDGPLRADVERRIHKYGLDQQVIFVGQHSDVTPFLWASDIGILPSTVETFSLFALEAMATGLPMVMSDIGGASEMIEDGVNGRLVPVGNSDALVSALRSLFDPVSRHLMRSAARDRVVTMFDIDRMVDAYEREFERLIVAPC